jgi:hypothetical protein
MDIALADALIECRGSCPYNQDSDFVFGSPEMKGKQPFWPDTLQHKILKPAARRAKITKRTRLAQLQAHVCDTSGRIWSER